MFAKFKSIIDVFRKGTEVANVESWKTGQITGTIFGAAIIAVVHLAEAYDHPLPIDTDSANAIGGGIVAIVNILLTAATSKRAGLLPAKATEPDADDNYPVGPSVQNPNISDETRAAALQSVRKTETELFGNLDTTYSGR